MQIIELYVDLLGYFLLIRRTTWFFAQPEANLAVIYVQLGFLLTLLRIKGWSLQSKEHTFDRLLRISYTINVTKHELMCIITTAGNARRREVFVWERVDATAGMEVSHYV